MKHKLSLIAVLSILSFTNSFSAVPNSLDSIQAVLARASKNMVQEKVYVHLDNSCYFIGDTIWYKAYVVRADNLKFTDMSRILYVELLSPDGLVVERQQLIVSDKGYCCGDFELKDSLYSGFYEIRAYTRWMLNFNVTEHHSNINDRASFYDYAMAHDYFRQYDALYSRVFPIYSKPDSAGNYLAKRMYSRPKQRIPTPISDNLDVKFYPEGGNIIQGITSRIAFEAVDQNGKGLDIKGTISDSKNNIIANISTSYMGRGEFKVNGADRKMKATFSYKEKKYTFDLPEAMDKGATIQLNDDGALTIESKGLNVGEQLGLSVLCRGCLKVFKKVTLDENGKATANITKSELPTGVNDLTLFDSNGQVLADRLFFVNNHDYDGNKIKISGIKSQYEPYEKISLDAKCEDVNSPVHFSLAICDNATDELSYYNGNILTDMLLSSDLKGFIAYPNYYFESNDIAHKQALDLLMLVQGWRKYNWETLADTAYQHPRYKPETTMTVEGGVYKMIGFNEIQNGEMKNWLIGKAGGYDSDDGLDDTSSDNSSSDSNSSDSNSSSSSSTTQDNTSSTSSSTSSSSSSSNDYVNITSADFDGVNHKGLKKEVMVKAELVLDGKTASTVEETKKDHFIFEIPPFYGQAFFFLNAYDTDTSPEKLEKIESKGRLDEDAYSEYYVKRNLFFPIYAKKYSYYENHLPEWKPNYSPFGATTLDDGSVLLKNVTVSAKKRGKRAINYSKPAWVGDAYNVYNNITDYGLSYGKLNFRQFPYQICSWLYGNMGQYRHLNIDARINGKMFYRSYTPDTSMTTLTDQWRSDYSIIKDLKLKRLQNIRIYTDYEPRNEDAPIERSVLTADFTIDFETIPNDGERYTYRDRRFILQGFYEPDEFYSPDYSNKSLPAPKDYRRTLYWNPNATTDSTGNFNVTFYNNATKTALKIDAEGLTPDGKFMVGEY